MSTFDEIVQRNGVGNLWYFGVSLDGGSTFPYYFSTAAFSGFDPRISHIGTLTRSLGADRGFTASTLTVTLDNTDGGVDWLSNRATYNTDAIQSVWRLYCVAWDQRDGIAGADTKPLCSFTMADPPVRRAASIEVSLADSSLSGLVAPAATPTMRDWLGITDANRPFTLDEYTGFYHVEWDIDAPFPLAFGNAPVRATYTTRNCYVICAVPDTAGILPTAVTSVLLGNGQSVPQTIANPANVYPGGDQTVWTIRRTPDIVKDGKTWHLLWLDLDLSADGFGYDATVDHGNDSMILPMLAGLGYGPEQLAGIFSLPSEHIAIGPISVVGGLMSHPADDLQNYNIHAATVISDLLNYCLPDGVGVSGASDVIAARPGAFVSGVIGQSYDESTTLQGEFFRELTGSSMSTAIKQICAIGDFDVFFGWNGTCYLSALSSNAAAQSTSLLTLAETLVYGEPVERIPAVGERNAPTNRTFIVVDGVRHGPIDDADTITLWRKPVARIVDGTWLPRVRTNGDAIFNVIRSAPLGGPGVETASVYVPDFTQFKTRQCAMIRPTLTVRTSINALVFELCDYIYFTWRSLYSSAIWRIESISVDPMSALVELTLVWCDDLRATDNLPYILDDESLYTRVAASGLRTCTLTDGSTTVAFSSGSLVTDGVVAGDSLIVRDSTESATVFKRNRVLRVVSRTDATHLVVDQSDFGSGGPFTITDWEVRKSALTTARAAYFGKTCNYSGQFSDGSTANRILEG